MQTHTLERIQALVDLEKNMNVLENIINQKDNTINALQAEIDRSHRNQRTPSPLPKEDSGQIVPMRGD